MNRVPVPDLIEDVPRPKCLPRSKSGVFRAVVVHANDNAQPADSAQVADPTPASPSAGQAPAVLPFTAKFRSPGKASVRMEVVEILAAVFGGMSNSEVGSIVNDDANKVQQIRNGAAPWTMDHSLWLARRRPDLYAEMDKRVRGVL